MDRRKLLKAAAVGAPLVALASPAIAQGKIEWKLPSSFPAQAPGIGTNVTSFAERVAKMSDGQLTFKIYSGGELVPPFGVEDATQQGTVEASHTSPYYSTNKGDALHFFSAVPFGMTAAEFQAWLKWGGGQELWDEVYAERNLVPIYSGNSGVQSAGWFAKPITGIEDFSGLNMRIGGLGGEVLRKFGVNTVLLPPQEVFPSFQSGAIDAAEWVGPFLDQAFGMNKVVNHCYLPSFHETNVPLAIVLNKDAFEGLPAHLQEIVRNAAAAVAVETLGQFNYFDAVAFKQLSDAGVQFHRYPDAVIAALKGAAKELLDEKSAADPQVARIRESYEAYLNVAKTYAAASEAYVFSQRL